MGESLRAAIRALHALGDRLSAEMLTRSHLITTEPHTQGQRRVMINQAWLDK